MTTSLRTTAALVIALLIWGSAGDAFAQWEQLDTGTLEIVQGLNFDGDVGLAVGNTSTLLRTDDGGHSWAAMDVPAELKIQAVHVEGDLGIAVGVNQALEDTRGMILRSTDGGVTWTHEDTGTPHFLSVQFIDGQTGMAVGKEGTMLRTTDGGQTWTDLSSPAGADTNWTALDLWGVFFTDAQTGWITGKEGLVLHTTDGGTTWQPQESGTDETLRSVVFTSVDEGSAVGQNGTIVRTTDGGATWTAQEAPVAETFFGISFGDAVTATVAGTNGTILRTEDAGATWVEEDSGFPDAKLRAVHMVDAETAYVAGDLGLVLGRNIPAEPTAIDDDGTLPDGFTLSQNYPNPFNPSTHITFEVPSSQRVRLAVYDLMGRHVKTLLDRRVAAGTHEVTFDGAGLASGVYVYRIEAAQVTKAKRMVLLK